MTAQMEAPRLFTSHPLPACGGDRCYLMQQVLENEAARMWVCASVFISASTVERLSKPVVKL